MKNRLTAMTFAIILFAAVLISLSCKDNSPSNTSNNTAGNNTTVNVNQDKSVQNSEDESTLSYDCSGTIDQRKNKVIAKIKDNIAKNTDLQSQYTNGGFNFDAVSDSEENLVLYIWGRVYTKKEDKVDDLNDTYKKFVKKNCLSKVVFDQPQNDKTTTARGFEYELCEAPKQVCPNGICADTCIKDANTNKNQGN